MEAQTELSHESMVPAENDWPSVPRETPGAHASNDGTTAMNVDEPLLGKNLDGSNTDGLSMDVIAAAQALEGLRAGNECFEHRLHPGSQLLYRFYASSVTATHSFDT